MLAEQSSLSKTDLTTIAGLMKERATFVQDILSEGAYLFEDPSSFDEGTVQKKWKEGSAELMKEWMTELNLIEDFSAPEIEARFKSFIALKELGIGAVLPLFRLLVTGQGMGPSMFEISAFLGKELCIKRMENGLAKLA